MTEFPLVSIVIPVFNGANYVGDAIESALGQNYPCLEVIVVDDGSNDGGATSKAVKQFEPHVHYIEKPNGGVATALNAGISAMRGELFSWLSHDDLYKPNKVARQVQAFRNFGASCVVIGDFELMNERGEFMNRISLAGRNLVARPLDAVFRGLVNGCALLVPKHLFDEVGTFEPGLPTTQDYHLWYRIACSTPFVHCPHADVRQRVHPLQGSRHASHLDEASRMFIHLIDSTPFEVMRAYDGSPLRFLMKVRECLHVYPGLRAYLDFRIDELLRQVRYSVVYCSAASDVPPAWATRHEASADTVVFLPADKPPKETEILAGLRCFIQTDSDIVRPKQQASGDSALERVIARRSALSAIEEAFSGETSGWHAIAPHIRVAEYPASEPIGQVEQPLPKSYRQVPALGVESLARTFRGVKQGASALSRSLRERTPARRIEAALGKQSRVPFSWRTSERAVAAALTATHNPALPTIFFLSHRLGGGAHRHLAELMRALKGRANCIAGFGGNDRALHVGDGSTLDKGRVVFYPEHLKALVRILHRAGVSRVDVHHTLGFDEDARKLLDSLGVPFDVTMVDYHLVAAHPHLCFGNGRFVGDSRLRDPECGMLRAAPLPVLNRAERVITLCRDMGARMRMLNPDLPLVVARHWLDSSATRVRHVFVPRMWANEPLRIVVVGWIVDSKGRLLIQDAARIALKHRLPIRFHVLGEMDSGSKGEEERVDSISIHGRFDTDNFSERLGAIAPHVAWLPTQVPETWSYVLTDLMESALPVAASAIGAIPERCYGRPVTWLLPWEASAETWVDLFLKLHATQLREPPLWTSIEGLPPAEALYFDEYLRPAEIYARKIAGR